MPITASSQYPQVPAPGANAIPSLNLPGISATAVNPNDVSTSGNTIYNLLSNAPQSLTSAIGPLLQQIFGAQSNLMAPVFAQQGQQGAAAAQSDAMARGLTGSSIEAANMTGARTQANQGYDQYIAQMLQGLVPAYTGAAQFDIGNTQSYYGNLAQAVGQHMAQNIQQDQFTNYMNTLLQQAGMTSNAQMTAGIAQGAGTALSRFSDIRLKEKVVPIAYWKGMTFYTFYYKDNEVIKGLPKNQRIGLMGHEVHKVRPDCVKLYKGYFMVDYPKLFNLKLKPLEFSRA